jgi:hypothetical protein
MSQQETKVGANPPLLHPPDSPHMVNASDVDPMARRMPDQNPTYTRHRKSHDFDVLTPRP